MTLRDIVLSVLRVFVGSAREWPDEAEELAEKIAHKTDLTQAEAVVAAGDIVGVDDRDIQHRLAYSSVTVPKVRKQLRQRGREEDDTDDVIEEWTDSATATT